MIFFMGGEHFGGYTIGQNAAWIPLSLQVNICKPQQLEYNQLPQVY